MSQLHRATRVARGSGVTLAGRTRDDYRVTVLVTPDRVTSPDHLSVRVTRNGRPLKEARVGITFSRPSMNMWDAYRARLAGRDRRPLRRQRAGAGHDAFLPADLSLHWVTR